MAYGKCLRQLLAGTALAVTAALAAAGCAPSPATSTASATPGSAGTPPALTTAQARQIFGSYLAVADRAAATGNTALAFSRVSGVQKYAVSIQLKAAKLGAPIPSRYTYGTPVFFLPRPDGYPRWFVASVRRTLVGQPGSPGTTAGMTVAPTGQVLMAFQQDKAAGPWLLTSSSQLAPGATVPPLATDSAGYVATVPLDSGTQLARPDVTGPLQAAVVDDGPASPAAKVVAAGDLTTGLYDAARSSAAGLAPPPGDVYQWELEGSKYDRFALRTADGGALVFYAMYLDSTVEVPALLNKQIVTAGPPITVPGYADFLLKTPRTTPPRLRVDTQQLLSFAAVDPPAGAAKIRVIAMGGGLIYADAS